MRSVIDRVEVLDRISSILGRYQFLNTVVLSLILLLFYYLVRFILNSNIERRNLDASEKTLYKKKVGQYLFYILLTSFLLLWVSQLQVFFVSLMAVAAAIVIALKELIMCITGGTLIKIGKVFKTGDRIELSGSRGFVIEKNLLTTKILEIGPEKNSQQTTGDIITIPNSLMLSKTLKNESYFKGYSIKTFHFKISKIQNFEFYEKGLLKYAQGISKEYEEEARYEISRFCTREGISIPAINPRTKIIIDEKGGVILLIKLPVKNAQVGEIEQGLNRCYLNLRMEKADKHILNDHDNLEDSGKREESEEDS